MTFDSRWKNPQGSDPKQLHQWAQDLVRELRKGDYLDSVVPDLTGQPVGNIDFTATQRVLGRNTGGAGVGEEVTLSQLLDWVGSANRGDILRRGASAWESLNVGSSGQVLTSDGTDPGWATPSTGGGITTIASGSLSGNAVTITSIPETYAYLVLHVAGGSMDTNSRFPRVRASVNNGSSYDATAGNYTGEYWNVATAVVAENSESSLIGNITTITAASTFAFTLVMHAYQTGPFHLAEYRMMAATETRRGRIWYVGSTDNIDALQIIMSASGNFDAGTYALYGIS